jgi:general secretion pathway protein I
LKLFRKNRSEPDDAGFTLIEALVALALVAVLLAAIGPLIASSMRGVRSVEQHGALVATARAVEAGLPERRALAAGSLTGQMGGNRWRVDIMPYSGGGVARAASTWIPQTVVITVAAPSGARLRIESVRLSRRTDG